MQLVILVLRESDTSFNMPNAFPITWYLLTMLLDFVQVALDKAVDIIQASGESYYQLVYRIDKWLQQKCTRAITLLTDFNADGVAKVTYGQFKAAMHDLAIPFTSAELHLLCKLLDFEQKELIDV